MPYGQAFTYGRVSRTYKPFPGTWYVTPSITQILPLIALWFDYHVRATNLYFLVPLMRDSSGAQYHWIPVTLKQLELLTLRTVDHRPSAIRSRK